MQEIYYSCTAISLVVALHYTIKAFRERNDLKNLKSKLENLYKEN